MHARTRTRTITAAAVVVAILAILAPPAQAWKPHTHLISANESLLDARDAHICLPGLSSAQIPIGENELVGHRVIDGRLRTYNRLVELGPYVRAGALGPDAIPDAAWGQLAVHVDHSDAAAPVGEPVMLPSSRDACDGESIFKLGACITAYEVLDWLMDHEYVGELLTPLFAKPSWESIDWGHEMLRQALRLHVGSLDGRTLTEIRADAHLAGLLAEREASIAYALGYLMHMGGDAFGHGWVNRITREPFSWVAGRQTSQGGPLALAGELLHMALEKYVDHRYLPGISGDGCDPVGREWTEGVESTCETQPKALPVDCSQCNPLRVDRLPPDHPLSTMCDDCFPGCNPWRRVCPPRPPEGLPCSGECVMQTASGEHTREEAYQICREMYPDHREADGGCDFKFDDCIDNVDLSCADQAMSSECCERAGRALVNLGGHDPRLLDEMCAVGDDRDAGALYDRIRMAFSAGRTQLAALAAEHGIDFDGGSPCGCFQGPLGSVTLENKVSVDDPAVDFDVGTELGVEVDLDEDGQPDLLNECVYWNCLLQPGSEYCPIGALSREPRVRPGIDEVFCDDIDVSRLDDPDEAAAYLADARIAVPGRFYNKMFLERRFPSDKRPGSVGTYALGGPVVNTIHVIGDVLLHGQYYTQALANPIGYIIDRCPDQSDQSAAECVIAAKILAVYTALGIVTGTLAGIISATSWVAPEVAAWAGRLTSATGVVMALIEVGIVPGIGVEFANVRRRLIRHLEDNWVPRVVETARAMSGESCPRTCSGEPVADCTRHRFLALHEYFDFTEGVWGAFQREACEQPSLLDAVLSAVAPAPTQLLAIVSSGGPLPLAEWIRCEVAGYFFDEMIIKARDGVAKFLLDETASTVCSFIADTKEIFPVEVTEILPYGVAEEIAGAAGELPSWRPGDVPADLRIGEPEAWRGVWKGGCKDTLRALFGSKGDSETAGTTFERMRDLVAAVDTGEMPESLQDQIDDWINARLEETVGITVDFDLVRTLSDSGMACVPTTSFVVEHNAAEQLLANLERQFPDAAERLARVVENVGRVIEGLENLDPMPADVDRFAPLYNTVQLNKLILLGSGAGECSRLYRMCRKLDHASHELIDWCDTALAECGKFGVLLSSPASGIRGLIEQGNAQSFGPAFALAYDVDKIEADPYTYLESFYEDPVCTSIGHNIMCNAVPSLDDPDQYCRDLAAWWPYDPALFPAETSECALMLSAIDLGIDALGAAPYAPDPRARPAFPDPRDDQSIAYAGRSVDVDRVVRQCPRDDLDCAETLIDHDLVGGPEPDVTYYPYDLNDFALTRRDNRVARLYSRVFAPFHCPQEGGRRDEQPDWDCDTVPDACDNCPHTYNPDQLDVAVDGRWNGLGDGIGDDCPSLVPGLILTPVDEVDRRCGGLLPGTGHASLGVDSEDPVDDARGTGHAVQVWRIDDRFEGAGRYKVRIQHAASGRRGAFHFTAWTDDDGNGRPDREVARSALRTATAADDWSEWSLVTDEAPLFFGNLWTQSDEIIHYRMGAAPSRWAGLSNRVHYGLSAASTPRYVRSNRYTNLIVEVGAGDGFTGIDRGALVTAARTVGHQTQLWEVDPAFQSDGQWIVKIQHAATGSLGGFYFTAWADSDGDGRPDTELARSGWTTADAGEWSAWTFASYGDRVFLGNTWPGDRIVYYAMNDPSVAYHGLGDRVWYARTFGSVPQFSAAPRHTNILFRLDRAQ